jgi:hypothetical protein
MEVLSEGSLRVPYLKPVARFTHLFNRPITMDSRNGAEFDDIDELSYNIVTMTMMDGSYPDLGSLRDLIKARINNILMCQEVLGKMNVFLDKAF